MLGHAAAAIRAHRPPALPAAYQDDAHHQAGRASASRYSPGPDVQIDRSAVPAARRPGRPSPTGTERGTDGGPARHPAVGAVRIQPGHGRGDREPARPGGNRARLRRHARPAGRPRQRPAPRGRRCWSSAPPTTGCRRTTPRHSAGGSPTRPPTPPPACPTPSSAAATPSGPPPTRPCRPCWTSSSRRTAAQRLQPRGEGNAAGDFDAALPLLARRPVDGGRLRTRPAGRDGRPRTDRPAAVDHADQPAGQQPGDHRPTGPGPRGSGPTASCSRRPGGTPDRSTRHIEIALPEDMTYRAGDHLGVLPRNNIDLIRRVIARFGLDAGQYLTIIPNSGTHTHLPIDEPTPLLGVLASCVELQDVARRDDIEDPRPLHRRPRAEVRARVPRRRRRGIPGPLPRTGVRDQPVGARPARAVPGLPAAVRGVPRHAAAAAPALLLDLLLPAGQPGGCAASPPAWCAGPARSGTGTFTGVASGHLAQLPDDGTVFVFVREPTIPFRPPAEPKFR